MHCCSFLPSKPEKILQVMWWVHLHSHVGHLWTGPVENPCFRRQFIRRNLPTPSHLLFPIDWSHSPALTGVSSGLFDGYLESQILAQLEGFSFGSIIEEDAHKMHPIEYPWPKPVMIVTALVSILMLETQDWWLFSLRERPEIGIIFKHFIQVNGDIHE